MRNIFFANKMDDNVERKCNNKNKSANLECVNKSGFDYTVVAVAIFSLAKFFNFAFLIDRFLFVN